LALDELGIKYQHVFSSETNAAAIKLHQANFKPDFMFRDVTARDTMSTPCVDLYVAGFPCQSFSTAGKRQGFNDEQGRGKVFKHILDYIDRKRPKIFVLENVKGLRSLNRGEAEKAIVAALEGIRKGGNSQASAYEIHVSILNTMDDGIAQNRPRWYCVGLRKDAIPEGRDQSSFAFPARKSRPSLESILDPRARASDLRKESSSVRANVERAIRRIHGEHDNTSDVKDMPYVVDVDASQDRSHEMLDTSPCLTRSRYRGHWLLHKGRRMTLREMARLQGIDLGKLNMVVTKSEMGQLIGNAMTVPVVGAVIEQALQAMGLHSAGRDQSNLGTRGESQQSEVTRKAQKPTTRPKSRPEGTLAAPTTEETQPGVDVIGGRSMMIDSGASCHIVNEGALTPEEIRRKRPLHRPLPILTANGYITATHCTDVHIPSLDIWVEALILEKSPSVLSIGRLVTTHGVQLEWIDNVPTLRRHGQHHGRASRIRYVPC